MIKSMTAFGRAKREGEDKDITVELRSVNSRFFDCSVRLPRAYSFMEEKIKAHIQKNGISRGKVDVYITVENHTSEITALSLDSVFAERYITALRQLRDKFELRDDISVMSVAKHPEVLKASAEDGDLEGDGARLIEVLDEALSGYLSMREDEGERILDDITAKIEQVREYAIKVEQISKEDNVGYRDKLEERLRKILGDNSVTVDENRLLTECAIWADKIAIDEELVRLRSHFDAFYDIIKLGEPSGRKLDFLMQELNRETNTIGSKANNAKIARLVVDMKGELEKIREQIQNVE